MIKILFIFHGNICRSPMAEFVMKKLVSDANLQNEFIIDSAATSTEELGNGMHRGTLRMLQEKNIPYTNHRARQITKKDLEEFDYLIGMDSANIRNMKRFYGFDGFSFGSYSKENSSTKKELENKICKLLEFAGSSDDIADPWYTGNFDLTYNDVLKGCKALLNSLT
jgi:protein-tyrosine phosphatase